MSDETRPDKIGDDAGDWCCGRVLSEECPLREEVARIRMPATTTVTYELVDQDSEPADG